MSTHPVAVTPVVDYEPPPRAVEHHRASPPVRRRSAHPPPRGDSPPAVVLSPALQSTAAFADAALRRVLEVIDRRRPLSQLRPLLTTGLADSVLATSSAAPRAGNAAMLRRVRLQVVGPADPPTAAEVFGTYTRGRRNHAIAGRIERGGAEPRWQIVALHIG